MSLGVVEQKNNTKSEVCQWNLSNDNLTNYSALSLCLRSVSWWGFFFFHVRHFGIYLEPFLLIPLLFCLFLLPYMVSWRWSPIVLSLDSPFVLGNILTILFTYLHSCGNPCNLWGMVLACMHPGSGSCFTSSVNLIGPCGYHRAVVVYVLWSFSWGVRSSFACIAEDHPTGWRVSLYFPRSSLILLYYIFKQYFS